MRLRLPQHQKLEREKMREDDKREDNFRATQLRERENVGLYQKYREATQTGWVNTK